MRPKHTDSGRLPPFAGYSSPTGNPVKPIRMSLPRQLPSKVGVLC
jgi:hypothetical protein